MLRFWVWMRAILESQIPNRKIVYVLDPKTPRLKCLSIKKYLTIKVLSAITYRSKEPDPKEYQFYQNTTL